MLKQNYKVHTLAKAGGVEVATFHLLNSAGIVIPGGELKLNQPKGGGLYASLDDGDLVEVTFTKLPPAPAAEKPAS